MDNKVVKEFISMLAVNWKMYFEAETSVFLRLVKLFEPISTMKNERKQENMTTVFLMSLICAYF